MTHAEILQVLAARRRSGSVTAEDVAKHCEVTRPAVSMWESGSRAPRLPRFLAWADALGYDVVLVPRGQRAAAS